MYAKISDTYILMTQAYKTPRPLFDSLDYVVDLYRQCQHGSPEAILSPWLKACLGSHAPLLPDYALKEYHYALLFLYSYRGSKDTFNAYRRELERFLQWSWFVKKASILDLKRLDIEDFIEFCKNPPKGWINTKIVSRFVMSGINRIPNTEWRPFTVKVSKKAHQDGERPDVAQFELSQQALKQIFNILGSFYNFLIQEETTETNPLLQIRQKSKFLQRSAASKVIRRLSDTQWKMVLESAKELAALEPEKHHRTLFIMQCLYGMYLRISELVASDRWTPHMCDFFRDHEQNWWFKTVGKGNKQRQIAVSEEMLQALRGYRQHLRMTPLPAPDDQHPLIPRLRGKGPVADTSVIRDLVQQCFDHAVFKLKETQPEEADLLRSATVHWLRHTGISDDVKIRPREHVRDDAGHSSSAITDRYIDIELKERAKSAKGKTLE